MGEGFSVERIPETDPVDKEWFGEFVSAGGSMEAYDYLDGDKEKRAGERALFETDKTENPKLDYPKLNAELLETRSTALRALKEKIIAEKFSEHDNKERMEMVQQVYRWKINEKLAEVGMLQASLSGDMRRFKKYSEFVYGKPSPEILAYTVSTLREQINGYKQSENQILRNAAIALEEVLPTNLGEPKQVSLPDQKTFDYAKLQTNAELGNLVDLPVGKQEFGAEDIESAFLMAIKKAKIEGWKAVIDPSKPNISASQEKKTVYIPEKKNVGRDRITELIYHEIGTHAVRRNRGERSKLMLLELGLDRYRDDEGVTGLREQILESKMKDFSGLEGHLAISLAVGTDGTPRDFRAVYDIMQKYFIVEELASGKEYGAAQKSAMTKSWNRCIRTFRGTNCSTPGVAFTKDILYREANMDVWEVVRNTPQEIMRFNVGKYDPANPRHIMVLDQLGVTDADLASLES